MKTKYNLEKQIVDSRSILDNVDKVGFKSFSYAVFEVETDETKLNYNYPTKVVIDLSKSNYFIVDPSHIDYTDTTDAPPIISVEFINYSSVQRFEILILTDVAHIDYDWDRSGQDVIFPFGEGDPNLETSNISAIVKQKVVNEIKK